MHFLLFYDYVEDILERRAPHRAGHLALVGEYAERGEVILAGAFVNPTDGATLVFQVENRSQIEDFVQKDPYVINGLVTEWRIREWKVVAGSAL